MNGAAARIRLTSGGMNRVAQVSVHLRRAVLRRRRLLAALAAGTAVAAGLQAAAGPPPPKEALLTAAHDLSAGAVVRADDVTMVEFDPESVPTGVVRSVRAVVGRTTATPVRSGEPITDVRLMSGSMLAAYPGTVAAPVRIGDPGAVAILQIGDRVDLIAADPHGAAEAQVVVADAPVIGLPRRRVSGSSVVSGGLVVVAVSEATARALAAAGVSHYLSLTIKP